MKNSTPQMGNSIFQQEISEEIYGQNYKFDENENRWSDTARRVVETLLEPDEDHEDYCEIRNRALDAVENRRLLPGGRVIANVGTPYKNATAINCYVSGPKGQDIDSIEEIMAELKRCAKILAAEGGYGFNADWMRPRGSIIRGTGARTPGAVEMLDMWDQTSETLTKGPQKPTNRDDAKDKIRKGAMMVTMSVWHPDVTEFIEAKQESGRLSKFNMSVLVPDAFMRAVENDEEWKLVYPDYEANPEVYEEEWNGSIVDWTHGNKVYDTIPARDLWNKIMESTYNRNEPGVLFYDTINDRNPLYYEENIKATNACSEWPMPPGGTCNLTNLVIPRYVDDGELDWEQMAEDIKSAVRMADNVNDLAYVPFERQQKELQNKRRIGLGHMGFGSACIMLGIEYGSERCVQFARDLQYFITNEAYMASASLAKEKEPFPLYDEEKYMNGDMVQRLATEVQGMIELHGLRNSHLTSIQPTGNTSILAGNVSGGLEPVFMTRYTRTAEQPHLPEGISPPKSKPRDRTDQVVVGGSFWIAEPQGDELVWRCREDGFEDWQIHPTRGIVKDEEVIDYGILNSEFDGSDDHVVTAQELTVQQHVDVMEAFAEFVDSSMAKTINIPSDYPFEDFKDLYKSMWETGVIKGGTTYRAGSMSAVLSETDDEDEEKPEAPNNRATRQDEGADQREEVCPNCDTHEHIVHEEGCVKCKNCGWEKCEL